MSEELVNACRRIYAQHRLALDLIAEHGRIPVLSEAFSLFKQAHPQAALEAFSIRSTDINFVASVWLGMPHFQVADKSRWGTTCPIKFWFRIQESSLFLRLEVGPIMNNALFDRTRFVQELRTRLRARETQAIKIKDSYTRVRTHKITLTDEFDIADASTAMAELWRMIGAEETVAAVTDAASECVQAGRV